MALAAQRDQRSDDRASSNLLRSVLTEMKRDARVEADAWKPSEAAPNPDEYLLDLRQKVTQKRADLEQEQREILERLDLIADLAALWQTAEARIDDLVADRDRWASQVKALGTELHKQKVF